MLEELLKFTGLQLGGDRQADAVGRWPAHPLTVSVQVQPARSFHPILHYNLSALQRGIAEDSADAVVAPPADPLKRPGPACHQLLMYQPLPADLFVDPFQLEQLWPQSRHLYWRHDGPVELERPVDEVPAEGSGLAITLWSMPPPSSSAEKKESLDTSDGWRWPELLSVPVHGRYQVPMLRGVREVERRIPVAPATFYWRCQPPLRAADEQWAQLERVDAAQSAIARLYPDDQLYQLAKVSIKSAAGEGESPAPLTVVLPAGQLGHASLVALGTMVCVMIGLIWLIWAVYTAKMRPATAPVHPPTATATTRTTTEERKRD